MEKSSYTMYIARSFNFTFLYIDDVLSLINAKIDDLVAPIYPTELEMEETTVAARSVSYLETTPRKIQWEPVKNETLRQKR